MPAITPADPVGTEHNNTIVVICPTCGQKRFANKMKVGADGKHMARTTCCSTQVVIR